MHTLDGYDNNEKLNDIQKWLDDILDTDGYNSDRIRLLNNLSDKEIRSYHLNELETIKKNSRIIRRDIIRDAYDILTHSEFLRQEEWAQLLVDLNTNVFDLFRSYSIDDIEPRMMTRLENIQSELPKWESLTLWYILEKGWVDIIRERSKIANNSVLRLEDSISGILKELSLMVWNNDWLTRYERVEQIYWPIHLEQTV